MTDTLPRRATPPLAALAALLVACRGIAPGLVGLPGPSPAELVVSYNHAILELSYQENGFIRRGLGGTIMLLLEGRGGADAAAGFWVFGAVWLLVPLTLLLHRLAALPGHGYLWFAAVLVLSPQLFLGWTVDVGRGDMLVAGFVAWAAIALIARRYALAVAPIVVGSLAHDTALFYGAALLLGVWLIDWCRGEARPRDGLIALALLGGALALVTLAQRAFGDEVSVAAAGMLARNPVEDSAAYYTLGGLGTLATSVCQGFARPPAWLYLASVFLVLPLYIPVLLLRRRLSIAAFLLAALLPMAAMTALAIDYGRWLMLAVLNAWLVAAVLRLRGVESAPASSTAVRAAALILAILLYARPATIYYATGLFGDAAVRIWGWTEELPLSMSECDPAWRTTLGLPPERP